MQCIRKNHKRSVFYDSETKRYVKVFTPKLELRIKYWLGLRKYPGLNFAHIANRLEELCRVLVTPVVVSDAAVRAAASETSNGEALLEGFVSRGVLAARGLDEPVAVWTLANGP